MVKVYAQTICLKDDPALIEEYKEYHRKCWPEVCVRRSLVLL
jgi:L-rhamnose mutarotase